MFKSIAKEVSGEIVEKKSRFIVHLHTINSLEEAEELIKKTNKTYFDAKHNCYAFRVVTETGVISRFSDDGEPSGTAGAPMLNILTAQNLANVLVIVTRYFGGILLGTGGLVKAYSAAMQEALRQAEIVEMVLGKEVKLVVNYADLEKLKYYLKQNGGRMVEVAYEETVQVVAQMEKEKWEEMLEKKENLSFCLLEWEVLENKCIPNLHQ